MSETIRTRKELAIAARDTALSLLPIMEDELECPACHGRWTQHRFLGEDYRKVCPCPFCKRKGAELAHGIDTRPYLMILRRQ